MEKVTLAEARLRQLAKERGFYDPANRAARVQLRDASQDWLLTNPPCAKVSLSHCFELVNLQTHPHFCHFEYQS